MSRRFLCPAGSSLNSQMLDNGLPLAPFAFTRGPVPSRAALNLSFISTEVFADPLGEVPFLFYRIETLISRLLHNVSYDVPLELNHIFSVNRGCHIGSYPILVGGKST